jgi:hypothetical protein
MVAIGDDGLGGASMPDEEKRRELLAADDLFVIGFDLRVGDVQEGDARKISFAMKMTARPFFNLLISFVAFFLSKSRVRNCSAAA